MTRFSSAWRALLLGTTMFFGMPVLAATTPPAPLSYLPAPAPANFPGVRVTGIVLGRTTNAEGHVVDAVDAFERGDSLIASIETQAGDPDLEVPGTLRAAWTYQNGQTVSDQTRALNFSGPGVTTFTLTKPDGWPVGHYHLTVFINGIAAGDRDFEVRE